MKDILQRKGILSPSGEVRKDKINLVSGAIVKPFAEMIWVTTNGDMDTINRLTLMFLQMNTPQERDRLFQLIQVLYALLGLQFSEEAIPMGSDPDVMDYFLFSFLADLGECILECSVKPKSIPAILLQTSTEK